MTKAKDFQYRIQYIDNTYQIVDWTKDEFKSVGRSMAEGKQVVVLDDQVFRLHDIRAIVFLPEPKQEAVRTKDEKIADAENQMTEWGFVDQETAEWLRAQGIDLSKGVN